MVVVGVAQCKIKLTSPLVERAISQDDEQSQVRGTPPKVIGRKRVQETDQCTTAAAPQRESGGRATYVPRSLPDRPAAPTSLTDAAAEGGGLPTAAACLSCRDRFVPPISDQGISTDGFNQRIL